jgi:hypothetical protein
MQFTSLFDNTGTTSTPSVPASTVTQANTNGWAVFVTITGGTLSSVRVNGTQVGTTAGTYVVPSGQTISITYTVAPTWNWVGVLAEHNALSTLPRSDTYASYFHGNVVGNPAASLKGVQLNYDGTRDNDGNLTFQADIEGDGFGMEWGYMLTPGLRADTTATTGTSRDDTASSAFGAQAYIQLTALIGTNVDVKIEHSADNSTFTTLIDFGSMTTPNQAARGSVSNSTTVNRYLRATTTGTFTYAQFGVQIVRNAIAGQVF